MFQSAKRYKENKNYYNYCGKYDRITAENPRPMQYIYISSFFIIIWQPWCPVVGRRPQHAVSRFACLLLSSAISCRSSICPGRLSTAWLVSLVVFSCRMVQLSSLRRLIYPAQNHFISFHIADYIYDCCPLPGPDPDVGLSIFVCDEEHTSLHVGLCGRMFVLCLYDQCPGLCTICHSWQHTGVVHLSLQADGMVAFEDIPVFGVCRPSCHDSSLHLFVQVVCL